MDTQDNQDLFIFWKSFDERLKTVYEKEVWKALPRLDKLVREKLGWRKRHPEDDYERFREFMMYVEDVYLKPSLSCNDSTWSDSSGSLESDESD
jgi:hypothetical protein